MPVEGGWRLSRERQRRWVGAGGDGGLLMSGGPAGLVWVHVITARVYAVGFAHALTHVSRLLQTMLRRCTGWPGVGTVAAVAARAPGWPAPGRRAWCDANGFKGSEPWGRPRHIWSGARAPMQVSPSSASQWGSGDFPPPVAVSRHCSPHSSPAATLPVVIRSRVEVPRPHLAFRQLPPTPTAHSSPSPCPQSTQHVGSKLGDMPGPAHGATARQGSQPAATHGSAMRGALLPRPATHSDRQQHQLQCRHGAAVF